MFSCVLCLQVLMSIIWTSLLAMPASWWAFLTGWERYLEWCVLWLLEPSLNTRYNKQLFCTTYVHWSVVLSAVHLRYFALISTVTEDECLHPLISYSVETLLFIDYCEPSVSVWNITGNSETVSFTEVSPHCMFKTYQVCFLVKHSIAVCNLAPIIGCF